MRTLGTRSAMARSSARPVILAEPQARLELDLELRDHGPGLDLDDSDLEAEIEERLFQDLGLPAHLLLMLLEMDRLPLDEHVDRRKLVGRGLVGAGGRVERRHDLLPLAAQRRPNANRFHGHVLCRLAVDRLGFFGFGRLLVVGLSGFGRRGALDRTAADPHRQIARVTVVVQVRARRLGPIGTLQGPVRTRKTSPDEPRGSANEASRGAHDEIIAHE